MENRGNGGVDRGVVEKYRLTLSLTSPPYTFVPYTNKEVLRIGALSTNASSAMECFNGLIDEVRIYNRALSDSEIQALYNATK